MNLLYDDEFLRQLLLANQIGMDSRHDALMASIYNDPVGPHAGVMQTMQDLATLKQGDAASRDTLGKDLTPLVNELQAHDVRLTPNGLMALNDLTSEFGNNSSGINNATATAAKSIIQANAQLDALQRAAQSSTSNPLVQSSSS